MPASRKYLDPETIARLRGLDLRARAIVSGVLSGMHRSAYHGYSVEFAEHRQYVPGDDIRHVDWRIFGRKDRLYIKQYEEETNLRCHLVVDASHSMAYQSGSLRPAARRKGAGGAAANAGGGPGRPALNKFEYAATLAASLAYLLVSQQDAAGLLTFDHEIRARLKTGTGKAHLSNLVALLEHTEPSGTTDVKILFHRLAEELDRRSMVVLISDLLADPDDVVAGLEHICYTGHELVVMHVMDDFEWSFPFVENVLFEGMEDDLQLLADPQSLRASYLEAVRRFVARVRGVCLKHRADYVPVNTRDPFDVVLCGYLSRRGGSAPRAGPARVGSQGAGPR